MNFLEERIQKDGIVKEGNVLKVDSFLNHQMDIRLLEQMGEEFKRRFADVQVDKILTIEASGIGIACMLPGISMCRWYLPKRPRASTWMEKCMWRRWNPLPINAKTRSSYPKSF